MTTLLVPGENAGIDVECGIFGFKFGFKTVYHHGTIGVSSSKVGAPNLVFEVQLAEMYTLRSFCNTNLGQFRISYGKMSMTYTFQPIKVQLPN
jgi:hypothetical protein